MKQIVVLDSSPLGLLFHRPGLKEADDCRAWLKRHSAAGKRFIVPEIVDYELRRELLRLQRNNAVSALTTFNHAEPDRFVPITSPAMELAAALWADARRKGVPTADRHALDVDAILAAQMLTLGLPADFVVATSNVSRLSQFVPAEQWSKI